MHHAYLLIGNVESAKAYIKELLGSLIGSPDYFSWQGESFGIGEARKLGELAQRKAFGERKVFFIAPEKITLEAENALLKTFEEPIEGTHFFLSVRDEGMIIPTLRSRMFSVRLTGASEGSEAKSFLKAGLKERLAFVKKFVDAEKNLPSFLDDLLMAASRDEQQEIYPLRLVAGERGASARLILEHLALVL